MIRIKERLSVTCLLLMCQVPITDGHCLHISCMPLSEPLKRLHTILRYFIFSKCCFSVWPLLSRFISTILLLHPCTRCAVCGGRCRPLPSHGPGAAESTPPAARTSLLSCFSSAIHELRSLLSQVNRQEVRGLRTENCLNIQDKIGAERPSASSIVLFSRGKEKLNRITTCLIF